MTDMKDIKQGDRVTFNPATVVKVQDNVALFEFASGYREWLRRIDIASVEPRQLAVGDRVTWGYGAYSYRILEMTDERVVLVDGKREPDGKVCPADGIIFERARFDELDQLRRAS